MRLYRIKDLDNIVRYAKDRNEIRAITGWSDSTVTLAVRRVKSGEKKIYRGRSFDLDYVTIADSSIRCVEEE